MPFSKGIRPPPVRPQHGDHASQDDSKRKMSLLLLTLIRFVRPGCTLTQFQPLTGWLWRPIITQAPEMYGTGIKGVICGL
jgi:hypothetical protein